MFDFFLAYPLACLMGLIVAGLAPSRPSRGFSARVRLAAAAAFVLTFVLATIFFSLSGAPLPEVAGIALLSAFWGGLFGTLGGLAGAAVRTAFQRR